MKYNFTFIMSSSDVGETIEQFSADTFEDAWEQWSTVAVSWIMEQLKTLDLDRLDVHKEIMETEAQLLDGLNLVWLADFCVDLSVDVIQVIVVGHLSGSVKAPG
jgi:hypothetical protein